MPRSTRTHRRGPFSEFIAVQRATSRRATRSFFDVGAGDWQIEEVPAVLCQQLPQTRKVDVAVERRPLCGEAGGARRGQNDRREPRRAEAWWPARLWSRRPRRPAAPPRGERPHVHDQPSGQPAEARAAERGDRRARTETRATVDAIWGAAPLAQKTATQQKAAAAAADPIATRTVASRRAWESRTAGTDTRTAAESVCASDPSPKKVQKKRRAVAAKGAARAAVATASEVGRGGRRPGAIERTRHSRPVCMGCGAASPTDRVARSQGRMRIGSPSGGGSYGIKFHQWAANILQISGEIRQWICKILPPWGTKRYTTKHNRSAPFKSAAGVQTVPCCSLFAGRAVKGDTLVRG